MAPEDDLTLFFGLLLLYKTTMRDNLAKTILIEI